MSIMVPKALIAAELNGTISEDTTLAVLGFMIGFPNTKIDQLLSMDGVLEAEKLLNTGQIVTSDGEIIQLEEESPSGSMPNQVSESLTNETPTEWIRRRFREIFPNKVPPTEEVAERLWELARTTDVIEDTLTIMEMSGKDIAVPAPYAMSIIRKTRAEDIAEQAVILRRTKANSPDTHIHRAMRDAERKMATMPPPGANADRLAKLREKREQLSG